MIGARTILTNTLFLMGASVFNIGVSILTTALIARAIGPELYGRYTFGLTYVLVFSVFSNFGIESLFIREASREKAKRALINDIFPLKIVLSVMTVGLVLVSLYVLDYPHETVEVVRLLCIGLFFQILYECLMSVSKALEEMYVVALFSVVFRVVSAAAIIASITSGIGFIGIVSAFALGNAVTFLVALWVHARRWGLKPMGVRINMWVSLICQGYPFFLSALVTMLYAKINVLMLSKMVPETNLGYFMAAANLVENLFFIPTAFNTTIFPAFSRMYGASPEALRQSYGKIVRYLVIITLGVSVGTMLVGEEVIRLLYGEEFSPAAPVLSILILYWALAFFSNIFSSLLFSIHQERAQARIMMIAAGLSIVLNAILIMHSGVSGAAFAAVVTEVAVVALMAAALWKASFPWPMRAKFVKLVINVVAMVIIVQMLLPVNLILAIIAGAGAYLLLLFPIGLVDEDDKVLVYSWIQKRFAQIRSYDVS
ncbi:MAG TPA: oligosaccharide flippase family protein [Nitrospira sp.]|nr:oligosaccharide flippase family protein [Nitrospira sp.]